MAIFTPRHPRRAFARAPASLNRYLTRIPAVPHRMEIHMAHTRPAIYAAVSQIPRFPWPLWAVTVPARTLPRLGAVLSSPASYNNMAAQVVLQCHPAVSSETRTNTLRYYLVSSPSTSVPWNLGVPSASMIDLQLRLQQQQDDLGWWTCRMSPLQSNATPRAVGAVVKCKLVSRAVGELGTPMGRPSNGRVNWAICPSNLSLGLHLNRSHCGSQ